MVPLSQNQLFGHSSSLSLPGPQLGTRVSNVQQAAVMQGRIIHFTTPRTNVLPPAAGYTFCGGDRGGRGGGGGRGGRGSGGGDSGGVYECRTQQVSYSKYTSLQMISGHCALRREDILEQK